MLDTNSDSITSLQNVIERLDNWKTAGIIDIVVKWRENCTSGSSACRNNLRNSLTECI